MKIEIKKLVYSALFITTLFLAGCADAGKDQTVKASSLVTLDGNNSTACVGGEIKKYKWKQIRGVDVKIENRKSRKITFIAPSVETETVLEFRLKTVEKGGHPRRFRSYDCVKITVQPSEGEDVTAPVITLKGDNPMKLKVGETYVEPGATAVDKVDGVVEYNYTGDVNTSAAGTYVVTYTAKDSAKNEATVERKIIVIDLDDNGTGVKSISNASATIGKTITHHVVMRGEANISISYDFSIEGSGEHPAKPNTIPEFNVTSMITYNNGKVLVPAHTIEFDIYISTSEDSIDNENNKTYTIRLGDASAKGTIIKAPRSNGKIHLTADWTVPKNALFLDIREDWERVESRPVGAIGGAIYGNPNFVDSVLSLAHNDKNKQIILICRSGSRTDEAVKILSNKGFSNVSQILGGMNQWETLKPNDILSGPLKKAL